MDCTLMAENSSQDDPAIQVADIGPRWVTIGFGAIIETN